jgi:hypothetical protein
VRWEIDDTIMHDPLRMCNYVIAQDVIAYNDSNVLNAMCAWNVAKRTPLQF